MGEGFCGSCANRVAIAKKTRARITSVYFGECTAVSSAEIHENGGRRDSIAKLVIFERTAYARGEGLLCRMASCGRVALGLPPTKPQARARKRAGCQPAAGYHPALHKALW